MKVMVIVKANRESEAGTIPISASISELLGCETPGRAQVVGEIPVTGFNARLSTSPGSSGDAMYPSTASESDLTSSSTCSATALREPSLAMIS